MKRKLLCDLLNVTKCCNFIKPFFGGIGHIIMLHRIVEEKKPNKYMNSDLEMSQEELEYCIHYYEKHDYAIISLDAVHEILVKGEPHNKFVSFTFDDGYVDNYIYAYPIFKKNNLPFTINLTSGFPDRKVIIWWYLLEDLLIKYDEIILNMNNNEVLFKCHTELEKYNIFNKIKDYILNSNHEEYFNRLDNLFQPYHINLYDKTEELALSWEQVVELSLDPIVTIAAHTVCHKPFSKLTKEKIKREIMGSVLRIETMIGKKVEHFSYPFGQCSDISFDICKEMGFKTATTTIFSNIFPEHKDYLERLPRIYEVEGMPLIKYLDIFASGTYSAIMHRFRKCITN